jgi:hypothetical protein
MGHLYDLPQAGMVVTSLVIGIMMSWDVLPPLLLLLLPTSCRRFQRRAMAICQYDYNH